MVLRLFPSASKWRGFEKPADAPERFCRDQLEVLRQKVLSFAIERRAAGAGTDCAGGTFCLKIQHSGEDRSGLASGCPARHKPLWQGIEAIGIHNNDKGGPV
jgi:hypothetical protein